jgi:hypothetical protein
MVSAGPGIEKRPASNDETQWPHHGVRSAMPGAAILAGWPGRDSREQTAFLQCFRNRAVLCARGQTQRAETACLCRGGAARLPMANFELERGFENLGNRSHVRSGLREHGQRHLFDPERRDQRVSAGFLRQRSAFARNSFRTVTGARRLLDRAGP